MYHNQELTIRLNQRITICVILFVVYVKTPRKCYVTWWLVKSSKKKGGDKTEKEGKRAVRETRGREKVEKEERTGEEKS